MTSASNAKDLLISRVTNDFAYHTRLEDEHLNTLIDEHLAAKVALADAEAYMEDYIDQLALSDGEYRVGPYKLKIANSRLTTKALVASFMTEKHHQSQVVELAKLCGWMVFHPYDSRRSTHGWPDLCLLRPPRLIFAELKTEKGKLTAPQEHWLEQLRQVPGVEVYLWKPSMWSEIEAVLR